MIGKWQEIELDTFTSEILPRLKNRTFGDKVIEFQIPDNSENIRLFISSGITDEDIDKYCDSSSKLSLRDSTKSMLPELREPLFYMSCYMGNFNTSIINYIYNIPAHTDLFNYLYLSYEKPTNIPNKLPIPKRVPIWYVDNYIFDRDIMLSDVRGKTPMTRLRVMDLDDWREISAGKNKDYNSSDVLCLRK